MTMHSVWGSAVPPGTYSLFNDGFPSIAFGHTFYLTSNPAQGGIAGVKVFLPVAGVATVPPRLRVKVWTNGGFDDPPSAEKVVDITAARGTWQVVMFDALLPLAAAGAKINCLAQFEAADGVATTYDAYYIHNPLARPDLNFVPSSTLPTLVWSENAGATRGQFFKSARTNSPQFPGEGTTGYGVDVIVSDAPLEVEVPAPVFGETVAEENQLAGSSIANWYTGMTSEAMPAFGRSTYVMPGQTIEFSVNYNQAFECDVYRLGHYQNNGARLVQSGIAGTPTAQPAPVVIPNSNGAVTCAAWSRNAQWEVPADALPGWYQLSLRGQSGAIGHVLFCVTDQSNKKPVLLVTGDATWHAAYNGFGGNNVYGAAKDIGLIGARALCSTYDKPVITRDYVPQTHFMNNTYPVLKFMEKVGYEVGVTTIEQIKDNPSIMNGRKLIIFAGHNEYIPDAVYSKTQDLLNSGQNFLNLAGNDFFWRVRYTNGEFDSGVDGRVMWCKKDSMDGPTAVRSGGGGVPFTTQDDWTGTWQDTRFTGRRPSAGLFGDVFKVNGVRSDKVKVSVELGASIAWRNCPGVGSVAYEFMAGSLGMEWDAVAGTDTPVGMERIALAGGVYSINGGVSDANGQAYNLTEDVEHQVFLMRPANSAGVVCNFNSDQWGWTLDALHLRGTTAADINAQQMFYNVVRDLGAEPDATALAAAGLVASSRASLTAYGFAPSQDYPPGVYYSNGSVWTGLHPSLDD